MSEDEMFEIAKSIFKKQKKDTLIEFLSELLSKLLSSGVSVGVEFEPSYIEGIDENGLIRKEYARYDKSPIRDTLSVNFAKHDKEVIDEFKKEFAKNIPSPKGAKH